MLHLKGSIFLLYHNDYFWFFVDLVEDDVTGAFFDKGGEGLRILEPSDVSKDFFDCFIEGLLENRKFCHLGKTDRRVLDGVSG